jgi:glycosyltransferase involved in cell wall biosynthesis
MQNLKVLMISTDRKIFEQGSAVSERMKEYGKLVEELYIVVLSDNSHGLKEFALDKNIWVYPTNSFSKWFRSRGAASIGKKIVLQKNFIRGKSVITAQDPFECGYAGLKIKNKWRIPLEIQLHTDPFSPLFTGWQNNLRKHIAKKTIEGADHIRVVSETVGSQLLTSYPEKRGVLSVLPIYVDKERIKHSRITFDLHARFGWHFVILCVARLTTEKNLVLALQVLERVRRVLPDTGIVFVGSGPEEDTLKKAADVLGVEKQVAFVGWQEAMASYYGTANLFLQTSLFEGYGLSLVEAGLSGLPIVSTPVGLARDLESGKDLLVCPHDDPDYMAQVVSDILEDTEKRDSLKRSMKETLERVLISKEEYMNELQKNWLETAARIS